jgi:hypothetical protein
MIKRQLDYREHGKMKTGYWQTELSISTSLLFGGGVKRTAPEKPCPNVNPFEFFIY